MRIIGLTGGIASGKSTAARTLKELGAIIIDADEVARYAVEPRQPAWYDIVEFFGQDILNPDNTINREKLGFQVFSQPEYLKKLNQMTHPRIMEEIIRRLKAAAQEQADGFLILEVPLLYETNMERLCDLVWVVWVDSDTQIRRLMNRDGISRTDALRRIESQMPLDEKARRADLVINNNGSPEQMRQFIIDNYHLIAQSSGATISGHPASFKV
ncbi:MAG: dephospho-CoA kinase [Syntrophomonadaceae bacterium]|jgi:dephospho-CoA kinase|nr:dephospho-CoA kinase [Syntrophomonadaceae bacterium]